MMTILNPDHEEDAMSEKNNATVLRMQHACMFLYLLNLAKSYKFFVFVIIII